MIVTRFAPSPTGYLHIGGARTALFCWLLARHSGGKMLLRIEDTDQKRNTPTATAQVINDLLWLGIDWDEGPDPADPSKSIGEHGPYLQSQRRDIYDEYLKKLLDAGRAYYCIDTPEEIQVLRQKAQDEKKTFLYPRPGRFPDAEEVAKARAEGRSVTVRFAMPDEDIVVSDVVRGEVKFSIDEISDFIIQKSDGFPTYHFACVVDDELMKVTHVIRGQEHLMNTPGHVALQRALGFRTPTYAHMSVTVSEGGGKLSKRERAKTLLKAIKGQADADLDAIAAAGSLSRDELDSFIAGKISPDQPNISAMAEFLQVHLPEINVIDFFQNGYIPEAMVNFVALLGWSPGDNREIMPVAELIEAFDLNRLNKTNSLFDRQKLASFNTEHLRMVEPDKLLGHFKSYLKVNDSPAADADDATLAQMLKISEGARTLAQIEEKCAFLFADEIEFDPKAVQKVLQKPNAAELLAETRAALAEMESWDEGAIHEAIEQLCAKNEVGMGKIAQPIRVAITGSTISPGIADSLALLGKEKTLKRIDDTLSFLSQSDKS
ncbi:MAG: glutamate--tRNA ligase [Sedimentisphaerales bacterium]|nr:glutamate--tRNA ligase [Sedimentisphaerales bacterium]